MATSFLHVVGLHDPPRKTSLRQLSLFGWRPRLVNRCSWPPLAKPEAGDLNLGGGKGGRGVEYQNNIVMLLFIFEIVKYC